MPLLILPPDAWMARAASVCRRMGGTPDGQELIKLLFALRDHDLAEFSDSPDYETTRYLQGARARAELVLALLTGEIKAEVDDGGPY